MEPSGNLVPRRNIHQRRQGTSSPAGVGGGSNHLTKRIKKIFGPPPPAFLSPERGRDGSYPLSLLLSPPLLVLIHTSNPSTERREGEEKRVISKWGEKEGGNIKKESEGPHPWGGAFSFRTDRPLSLS